MNRNFKSCIALALVVVLAFALVACGKKTDTPWDWAQNVDEGDIAAVKFTCRAEYYEKLAAESGEATDGEEAPVFKDVSFELNEKQVEKLRINLYRLEEESFIESDAELNKAPLYGFVIEMSDGTIYEINQSKSSLGLLEMTFGEKLWVINSEKFNSFVNSLIGDNGVDASDEEMIASSADLIAEEVTGADIVVSGDSYSTYGNLG